MTTLFEAKIFCGFGGSIPPPPPQPRSPPHLPDTGNTNPPVKIAPYVHPVPVNPVKEEPKKDKMEGGEGDGEALSPQGDLDKFLKAHSNFINIYKAMELGVPTNLLVSRLKLVDLI